MPKIEDDLIAIPANIVKIFKITPIYIRHKEESDGTYNENIAMQGYRGVTGGPNQTKSPNVLLTANPRMS